MEHIRLILTWAFAVCAVYGDIAATGPYTVAIEAFSPCDEIGSVGIGFNVSLVERDDGGTAYEGDITFPYDVDDEELLSFLKCDRWGSTGGWSSFYNMTWYDFITAMKADFPCVFEVIMGSMGVTGKPMKAGTYTMKDFHVLDLKLKKMDALPYGQYRFMLMQMKDDVLLGCLQYTVRVKEEASIPQVPGRKQKFG